MLKITFNPHPTEWDYHDKSEMIEDELTYKVIGPLDAPPDPPHATRFCRWSFVQHDCQHTPDIVIEEKKKDDYVEVARFVFDDKKRKWIGPPGSDDDVWQAHEIENDNAKFTELDTKDFPFYTKYVAPPPMPMLPDRLRPIDENDE